MDAHSNNYYCDTDKCIHLSIWHGTHLSVPDKETDKRRSKVTNDTTPDQI